MPGETTEANSPWTLRKRYDWRSWITWRALFAAATMMAVMCSAAALIAESAVRNILGMELGHAPLGIPEIFAFIIASGLIVAGLRIWFRVLVLANSDDGAARRSGPLPKRAGITEGLLEGSLFICWYFITIIAFSLLYVGTNQLLGVGSNGLFTAIVGIASTVGFLPLYEGLKRLGARSL